MPIKLDFEDPFVKPKEDATGITPLDFEDPFVSQKKTTSDIFSELLNPPKPPEDPAIKARELLNNAPPRTGVTGAVTDLAKGLYTGATRRVPELIGQAMQFSGVAPETGKAIADWGKEGEVQREKGLFEQTGEMIPSSSGIPLALGMAGKLVSMIPHPAAKVVGTGLQLATYLQPLIFGLSQAQQTTESGQEKIKELQGKIAGTTDETEKVTLQNELTRVQENSKWAPYGTGAIEWGGETLANYALQRLLGPLAGVVKNAGKATLKEFVRPTIKQFLKTLAIETLPIEVSTEFGQQWGEALVEKKTGIRPEANPLQEGIDVMAPTALMTLLTGTPAHVAQRYGVNRILNKFSKPVEGYDPNAQDHTSEIMRQVIDRKSMADIMAKTIEADDSPGAKELANQWQDYAYGQIALNLPIEVDKPVQDLKFQEPGAAKEGAVQEPIVQPEGTVTPPFTKEELGGVNIPAIPPKVERGPESEIKGLSDVLFEWTKSKPSKILDQEKYSPEVMAKQFGISVDLAKTALEETKTKLLADVQRRITNLEKHPDVKNREQRGPEEKACKPIKNYLSLLNQYSQLTGRAYDSTSQGGIYGEIGVGKEPGGAVQGQGVSGKETGPGGMVQGQEGQKTGEDLTSRIVKGENIEGFEFPEHYSPNDLDSLWGDIFAESEKIADKNKPRIDELKKERATLKSSRDKDSVSRKKQITEEIQSLDSESKKISEHADIAWQSAHEKLADKVIEAGKKEGINIDRDDVFETISSLDDGRFNESGWNKPLFQQVLDSYKEEQGTPVPKIKLTVQATPGKEGVTRLNYLKDGHIVGNARLLGGTIGDIQVNKKDRRQGIGLSMVQDLVERGGNSATTVNEASRGLFAKAGFIEDRPNHFVLKGEGQTAVVPTQEEIDLAAHEAETSPENKLPEPTPEQIEAGNYKKGQEGPKVEEKPEKAQQKEETTAEETVTISEEDKGKPPKEKAPRKEGQKEKAPKTEEKIQEEKPATPEIKVEETAPTETTEPKDLKQQFIDQGHEITINTQLPTGGIKSLWEGGEVFYTGDGALTQGNWVIYKDFIPKKIKDRADKLQVRTREELTVPVMEKLMAKNATGYSPSRYEFTIFDGHGKYQKRMAVFTTPEGKLFVSNADWISELKKSFPDLKLQVDLNDKFPFAALYSNDQEIGRLMGIKIEGIEDLQGETWVASRAEEQTGIIEEGPSELPKGDLQDQIDNMTMDDLEKTFDEVNEELSGETIDVTEETTKVPKKKRVKGEPRTKKIKVEPKERPVSEIIQAAASEGVKGIDETLKGLYEIFGGAKIKSFPAGFDAESYEKAKPHFQAAFDHFKAAGKNIKDFYRFIISQFGTKIKPYLMRFMEDHKKNKFKDIGVVWDPFKHKTEIDGIVDAYGVSPKSIQKMLDSVSTAKLIGAYADKMPNATPGTVRLAEGIRDAIPPFGKMFVRRISRYRRRNQVDNIYNYVKDDPESFEKFKSKLGIYGASVGEIGNKVRASQTATEAYDNFLGVLFEPNIIDEIKQYFDLIPRESNQGVSWSRIEDYKTDFGKELYHNINLHQLVRFVTKRYSVELSREGEEITRLKDPTRTRNKEIRRIGLPDYREGKNIENTEQFNAPFNFLGVGFGDYVEGEERQRVVNAAHDALYDLSELIGATPKGVAFNHRMALQFGNLGTLNTRAAALYVPSNNVINLSKGNGDGALAHEWMHGLDFNIRKNNFFSMLGGYTQDETSRRGQEIIQGIKDSFKTKYDLEAAEELFSKVTNPEKLKELSNQWSYRKLKGKELAIRVLSDTWEANVKKRTDFVKESEAQGGMGGAAYWSNDDELWARAGEAFVYDKLAEQGFENNYLVNDFAADGTISKETGYKRMPYPSGEERTSFNANLQYFFDHLAWDEDGSFTLDENYIDVNELQKIYIEEQKEVFLKRIADFFDSLYIGKQSEDDLYWYRYEAGSRGIMMQPAGFLAYDDLHEDADQAPGRGAVAYADALSTEQATNFHLGPIDYKGENKILVGGENATDTVRGHGDESLEEIQTEDGQAPGETGGTARGPDQRPGDSDSGAGGQDTGRGELPPGTGRGAEDVDTTPGREGGPETEPGLDALQPALNYRITDFSKIGRRDIQDRFRKNVTAIKVLKQIEAENRYATQEEQDALVEYSGWGGLTEALSRYGSKNWRNHYQILSEIMTSDEMDLASQSSITSYYTPGEVVQFTYDILDRMGFKGGKILDPSTGTGHYIGILPETMAPISTVTALEPDNISFRIANKLYPLSLIKNTTFEESHLPQNYYDLAVSNVPFNSDLVPADRKFNKNGLNLHNYFFFKSIHEIRPGGLVAFLTSPEFMNNQNSKAREAIAKFGKLIAAVRIPSIFSGTDIPTDMIILQRRESPEIKLEGESWINTSDKKFEYNLTGGNWTNEAVLPVNNYFIENPDMVIGDLVVKEDRWGALRASADLGSKDFSKEMRRVLTKIPKDIFKEYIPTEPKAEDLVTAPEDILFNSFYEGEDGKLYKKLEDGGRLVKEETPLEKTNGTKIRHFIGIVKARRALLQGQLGESTDQQIKSLQAILSDRYDTFVKKFGYLNARGNVEVFLADPSYADIATLEEWDEETQKGTKADIFTQRVVPRYVSPTKADTAQDALTYSLAEKGYVDLEYMSNLSGLPHQVILDQLSEALFEDPETGGFVTSEEYLSGNVVQKLRTAESLAAQDKRYVKNREALKEVQPKLLAPSDMDVSLGAPWVGGENYEQFVKELFSDEFRNIELQIKYNLVTGGWVHKPVRSMGRVSAAEATRRFKDASESRKATHDYGTSRMNFFQLLEKIMNSNRIFVTDPDPDHKGQRILNERETTLANQMAARINDKFRKWALFEDRERSDTLRQRYNQKINSYVLPEYDGDFLQFPGKNPNYPPVTTKRPDGLYKTQKNAVWRWITQGNTYLAHDMGTGKTITGALIAMEAKRLKLKKKPMIVTLKNVVQQYAAEFKRVYPSAKILVFDLKGGADKIRETLGKVVNNNWDAIIVSQPTFERIKMTPETNAYYLNQDLAEYYAYLQEIRAEEGTDARSVRQRDIVEAIQKLEAQIKRELAVNEEEKAKNIYFEELGVDLMIVDEAHAYKNVPYVTKRGNVKGVDPNRSATGRQVYYKTRWMNDTMLSPAGKPNGIVFMSGTMLSNSVGELFSIQRYLQPRALKEANLQHFDRWADTFGEIRQEAEPKLTGDGFQIVTKFANFVNVSDLKRMAYQNIDVVKSDDVGLTRPAIEGGEPHRVIIQQSPYVEQYQAIIRSRAETIKSDARHAEYRGIQDNMLRLVSDGSKVAIDQRLIFDYADTEMQEDSKINKAADNIVKYYQETKDRKGTQLVFCDLGVPRGAYGKTAKELTQEEFDDLTPEEQHNYAVARMGESATKFNVFDGLKAELIKRGIHGNEIAFIHDAEASSQKLKDRKLNALFKAFNSGKIRVLIGTTQKLGTGTNVQKKVVAIHHMDIWWNYAALGQRNARGWRAGNENKEVAIFEYATKATVDSFRWDKVATKGRVIDGFMSKNMTIRRVSDISEDTINARTMAAIASSDPRRLESITSGKAGGLKM